MLLGFLTELGRFSERSDRPTKLIVTAAGSSFKGCGHAAPTGWNDCPIEATDPGVQGVS
jgi:hypothetical protein